MTLPAPTKEQCGAALHWLRDAVYSADSARRGVPESRYAVLSVFEKAASALGLHVSAQPAAQPSDIFGSEKSVENFIADLPIGRSMALEAQQPQGDLRAFVDKVKSAAAVTAEPVLEIPVKEIMEAVAGIEALEAAAAQPEREAALVKALEEIERRADESGKGQFDFLDTIQAMTALARKARFDFLDTAYDTPAKDERREEAK